MLIAVVKNLSGGISPQRPSVLFVIHASDKAQNLISTVNDLSMIETATDNTIDIVLFSIGNY